MRRGPASIRPLSVPALAPRLLSLVSLALNCAHLHKKRVEDWEQFFEEKSRRRADKDRRKARVRTFKATIIVALAAAAAAGALFFVS